MDYVLVNDECDMCRYVSNAFSLLRFPLRKISASELKNQLDENMIAVLTCQRDESIRQVLKKSFKTQIFSLILLGNASKDNAFDDIPTFFLPAMFSHYELESILSDCSHYKVKETKDYHSSSPIFERLIGDSEAICKIRSMIKQVAESDSTVLILGQSGTGKDVIASCIHHLSTRHEKPFVPINCGAIPGELIESELFGHEKGAFTGALSRRAGRFEMANEGTLFLDEIGDMPLQMQVKLLRVIQDRVIERVGGNASINVDVRVIAATHKNLEEMIEHHVFREDLFYRLNVFPIHVPSLSERREDIPLLLDYHIEKIYLRLKHRIGFTKKAIDILCNYAWPGNIRELQNFLERMAILHPDQVVDETAIDAIYKHKKAAPAAKVLPSDEPFNMNEYIANIERQLIEATLEKTNGLTHAAADFLSLGKAKLTEKMKKYNLISES